MRWDEDHDSPDVVDRRGEGGGGGRSSALGLFALLTLLRSPFGWVVLLGIGVWFGLTRLGVIGGGSQGVADDPRHGGATVGATRETHFVSFVLDDVQDTWTRTFAAQGYAPYQRVESALHAAAAIGDDRLQRMATGTVSPEHWTHGSSDERVRWFRRGYEGGKIASCDTFAAGAL